MLWLIVDACNKSVFKSDISFGFFKIEIHRHQNIGKLITPGKRDNFFADMLIRSMQREDKIYFAILFCKFSDLIYNSDC